MELINWANIIVAIVVGALLIAISWLLVGLSASWISRRQRSQLATELPPSRRVQPQEHVPIETCSESPRQEESTGER